MAIYSNSLHYQRARFGSGLVNSGGGLNYFNHYGATIRAHANDQVHATTSWPTGYRAGIAAHLPLIDGGLSGRVSIESIVSAALVARGFVAATLNISITTTSEGDLLANFSGTTNITISTAGAVNGRGFISGTINIGASPSADDIAQAVWQMALPGGFSSGSAGDKLDSAGGGGSSGGGTIIREDELAQGGTSFYLTLNSAASSINNIYINNTLVIMSGTGAGQSRRIKGYNGISRRAYVIEPWYVIPDNTSVYRMIPATI